MTMKEFIKEYKSEIDQVILKSSPGTRINNEERRLWVLNDYGLYQFARMEGVKI